MSPEWSNIRCPCNTRSPTAVNRRVLTLLLLLIPATAFGAVHLPSWDLTAGTFGLGLASTPLYLRHRNVLPLGLYHGWLGAFYYRWVLDRNPWADLVR